MKTLSLLTAAACFLLSCTPALRVPQATLAERTGFKAKLVNSTIEGALSQPLARETEVKWQGAFWAMGLARYTSGEYYRGNSEGFRTVERPFTGIPAGIA